MIVLPHKNMSISEKNIHAQKSREMCVYQLNEILGHNDIKFKMDKEFSKIHNTYKRTNGNTLLARVRDVGRKDNMGWDVKVTKEGTSTIIPMMIRWFTDPSIFIKKASNITLEGMANAFSSHYFLFLNDPQKDKEGNIRQYSIIQIKELKEFGFSWKLGTTNGNKNCMYLVDRKGQTMSSKRCFCGTPIIGTTGLLTSKNFVTKIKSLF